MLHKVFHHAKKNYSKKLAALQQVIVLNKCDLLESDEPIKEFRKKVKKYKIIEVSALTGDGKQELIKTLNEYLKEIPAYEPQEDLGFTYDKERDDSFEVYRDDDGAYVVEGDLVKLLIRNVVVNDMDSMAYMQKLLRDKGVIKKLRHEGIKDGDTVVIGDIEFEFID